MTQFAPGFALQDGTKLQALVELRNLNASGALTAQADGTRANATPLLNGLNELGTVAGAADSALLPLAEPGSMVFVANAGAQNAQIFARGDDTINGTAGATGVAQNVGVSALYVCIVAGSWRRLLSA